MSATSSHTVPTTNDATRGRGPAVLPTASLGLLRQPPTVLVGRGVRRSLPDHLPPAVTRAVLVTDERLISDPDFVELTALVGARGIDLRVVSRGTARAACRRRGAGRSGVRGRGARAAIAMAAHAGDLSLIDGTFS